MCVGFSAPEVQWQTVTVALYTLAPIPLPNPEKTSVDRVSALAEEWGGKRMEAETGSAEIRAIPRRTQLKSLARAASARVLVSPGRRREGSR